MNTTNKDNLVVDKTDATISSESDVSDADPESNKATQHAEAETANEQPKLAQSESPTELSIYDALLKQTENIQAELEKLNNHKLVHTYNSIPRLLWFSLLKGISLGLGSVLGATVVLSTLVYLLSQMEFIPIIGEWISAILDVVKEKPEN